MGLTNSSCSFSRFRIIDPVPDTLVNDVPQRLLQYAFKDIENIPEMQSYGWVSFEDMLDTHWEDATPHKGTYLIFSLRLDTRRIPAGVIKKHVTIAIKEEKARLAERNQKFVARERQKEIKEQVLLKLRERFLPVPAEFNVLWNLQNHDIWFASIQPKMIDLFMEFFLVTFDLHLELLTPYNLAQFLLDEKDMTQVDALQATRFIALEKMHNV